MSSASREISDCPKPEEPMGFEPVDAPTEIPLDGQVEDQPKVESQTPDPARPDPLKLFRARWEHNKPAYEFLAGKHK
jgi:hypothetical protein